MDRGRNVSTGEQPLGSGAEIRRGVDLPFFRELDIISVKSVLNKTGQGHELVVKHNQIVRIEPLASQVDPRELVGVLLVVVDPNNVLLCDEGNTSAFVHRF